MQPHPGATTPHRIAPSHLAMLALGTGLYLGWQTIGISPTLFPQPAPTTYGILNQWSYLTTLLVIVILFLYATLAWRIPARLLHPRAAAVVTGLLVCLGTAATMYGGWAHPQAAEPMTAPLVLGQALLAAKAGFIILWGSALCRVGLKNAFVCVAGTYVVGFCICLLVAKLDGTSAILVRCILPAISSWAYLMIDADTAEASPCPTPSKLHGVPWRLLVGIGLFGAIIAFANHLSETKTHESTEFYTLIAGLTVSLIVLAFATPLSSKNGRLTFTLLYRLITPLIIGCLMLTLILEPGNQQYEALAIGGAWAFFRIFSWTLWCCIAIGTSLEGGRIFALGHVVLMVLSTIAESICILVPPANMPLTASVSVIVLLTVVTSTLIMNEGSLAPVVKESGGTSLNQASEPSTISDPTSDPAAARRCVEQAARMHDLSEREQEIATLVLLGHSNAQISDQISVAGSTLRTHLRNIYGKANVHSRQELVDLLISLAN